MMKPVEFWFDFASTYSYLAAMRVEAEAAARDTAVVWRPFVLGPIFAAQGWTTSPFALQPAKGRHMWRDLERRCAARGLAFQRPENDGAGAFPRNSVLAARMAILALEDDADRGRAFCRAVFSAEFAEGADIGQDAVLSRLAIETGWGPDLASRAQASDNKGKLRAAVDEAQARGVFGAPTFMVDAELFWGDDRLEDALDWSRRI